jgi:hypothetical protein
VRRSAWSWPSLARARASGALPLRSLPVREPRSGELRVVVTGVQVLFAFLLIVPFNTGFAHIGGFEVLWFILPLTRRAQLEETARTQERSERSR